MSCPPPAPPSCMDKMSHPWDFDLAKVSSPVICALKKAGFTPNMVTGLSILFSIVALYCLYLKKYIVFAVFALLAFWCDVMDGAMARRFKMTSPLGEILDHASDGLFYVGILAVLIFRFKAYRQPWLFAALLLSSLVPILHYASAAKVCGYDEGISGLLVTLAAPRDRKSARKANRALRWFAGIGYMPLMIALSVLIAKRSKT